MSKKPTVLMILDGYGLNDKRKETLYIWLKHRLWTS